MASDDELTAEIKRLRIENESLKKPVRGQISLKVSEKGGLSYMDSDAFRSHSIASNGRNSWE